MHASKLLPRMSSRPFSDDPHLSLSKNIIPPNEAKKKEPYGSFFELRDL